MKGLADAMLHLWIIPKPESCSGTNSIPVVDPVPNGDGPIPICRYVNLCLAPGSTLRPGKIFKTITHQKILPVIKKFVFFTAGFQATLLLENPVGENILTLNQLQTEVSYALRDFVIISRSVVCT